MKLVVPLQTKRVAIPNTVVALATYNGAAWLQEQLDSILAQTVSCTILIRDDGSTDGTRDIIKTNCQRHKNIIWVSDCNARLGPQGNFFSLMEAALKHPNWLYLCFADQDDLWMPEKIQLQTSALENSGNKPSLCCCDLELIDENGKMLAPSFRYQQGYGKPIPYLGNLLVENQYPGCSMMLNRKLVESSLPAPANSLMHDWWVALVAAATGSITVMPQVLVSYRQHSQNVLGASRWNLSALLLKLFDRSLMDKYYAQAGSLKLHLEAMQCDNESEQLIRSFCDTRYSSILQRLALLAEGQHHKSNGFHTIGLYMNALLYRPKITREPPFK